MRFPNSKNVVFVQILLPPNFSTKSAGMSDLYMYRVNLDVILFGQKLHFLNWETSNINPLNLFSQGVNDQTLKMAQAYRATILACRQLFGLLVNFPLIDLIISS